MLIKTAPTHTLLQFQKRFDLSSVMQFKKQGRLCPNTNYVIDLTHATFIDSSALGFIAALHRSCEHYGHDYAVIGLKEGHCLENLIKMVNFHQFMKTAANLDEALIAFANKATN